MTYPHAGTQSATLPYIKVQISSAGRSVGIIYTMIDCKFYVHIDCNATHIILHHSIAARGNESARKQADLPVAKSAQGTGTSQVLESLNRSAAQSRLTTHISNYPEARKG